jgi:hypothetical protein
MTDPAMWLESKARASTRGASLRVIHCLRGRTVTMLSSLEYLVRSSCLVTLEAKMGWVQEWVMPW